VIPLADDNPARRPPVVTAAICACCVLVFLWQVALGAAGQARAVYSFGVIPAVLFGREAMPPGLAVVPPLATVVTSMFLHGGWLHLGSNLLYLWIFGDNVEDALGRGRYLAFYLACGAVAALAQAFAAPASTVPMIGASGAISGVLGAYLLLYPRARVRVVIPIVVYLHFTWLPAMWLLLVWFAMQLVSALTAGEGGGVAFVAHVGGFLAGLVGILVLRARGAGAPPP
jgi:membrane associated rhomboid family serine protease